jgi:hypothetical protein
MKIIELGHEPVGVGQVEHFGSQALRQRRRQIRTGVWES